MCLDFALTEYTLMEILLSANMGCMLTLKVNLFVSLACWP